MDTENRVETVLRIPDDSLFTEPEQTSLTWDVPLTADELIGLLGTFSWIITMPDDRRTHVISEARRVLRDEPRDLQRGDVDDVRSSGSCRGQT